MEDVLWEGLTDSYVGLGMAETAENLAERYKLDRGCVDEFALRSQQLSKAAWDDGVFADEVVPMPIPNPKTGKIDELAKDEHMRPDTSAEKLAALKPVFRKGGVVTAGNASGINDAAAAVVLMEAQAAERANVKPMARLVAYGHAGIDPKIMGLGPVSAVKAALKKAGLTIRDIDVVESNEAFAAQAIGVTQQLDLDPAKVNPNGGAVALGHPIGATGCILTIKAMYELQRTGKRYGLITMCIGGGQGIAAIIERL
jgi:acetyl-CoA C-acetyltransferase